MLSQKNKNKSIFLENQIFYKNKVENNILIIDK